MLGLLTEAGHSVVNTEHDADVIIVNTCAFIKDARDESNSEIQHVSRLKKQYPDKKIIVAGCLPQRETVVGDGDRGDVETQNFASLRKRYPHIDAFIGVNDVTRIVDVVSSLEGILLPKASNNYKLPITNHKSSIPRLLATPSYTAYLRIADGCDKNCTYCVIPAIRGSYRSRPMDNIVAEARQLAASGVKEINVIAQDTTHYGLDLYGRYALTDLLRQLEDIDGLHWIRLLYAYPEGITDELVQFFAKSAKLCHYLDIPLQHADDKILRRMGRQSRESQLRRLVSRLRENVPDMALRTTFIVGFPGETDQQFENLYQFVEENKFDRCGVFEYSREAGTPAAKLAGQIEPKVKRERKKRVRQLQSRISRMINRSLLGNPMEVLFTGPSGGRSFRDAPDIDGQVFCPNTLVPGTFATVKICHTLTHDLRGQLCDSG